MRSVVVSLSLILLVPFTSLGQLNQEQFSRRGDILPDGTKPNVSFDLTKTVRNWSGTDGLGCCVMASARNNSIYLGMPDVGETIYRVSSSKEGGHWHEKFLSQMREVEQVHPGLKYWSDPSADYDELVAFSEKGLPIGITIGTGARYNMQIISHMVSAVKIGRDNELSAICDNNFPNEIAAMPTPIFKQRIAINSPTGKPWATIIFPMRKIKPDDDQDCENNNIEMPMFFCLCIVVSTWTWVIANRLFIR